MIVSSVHLKRLPSAARDYPILYVHGPIPASFQPVIADTGDTSYNNTPVGFAAYVGASEVLHLLLDRSNNFFEVVCCAYIDRARILLNQGPELARQRSSQGQTALHIIGVWLPDETDHGICRTLIELLLAAAEDIHAKNDEGQTPFECNQASGAESMAELLEEFSN